MTNVTSLVAWDSEAPEAVVQQLRSRISEARTDGREVAVAVVLITHNPDGRTYEAGFSKMPVEQAHWAGRQLMEAAWRR